MVWSSNFADVTKTNLKPARRVQVGKAAHRGANEKTDSSNELSVFEQSALRSDVANDSNIARNPLRGGNYGLDGGAVLCQKKRSAFMK